MSAVYRADVRDSWDLLQGRPPGRGGGAAPHGGGARAPRARRGGLLSSMARAAPRLAWPARRLAVIDVPGGAQPMSTDDGRFTIVYNGELFNTGEVRRELESAGHRFRSRCDTEVVLRGYAEWGETVLERLNGMWAFAVWDGARRTAVPGARPVGRKAAGLRRHAGRAGLRLGDQGPDGVGPGTPRAQSRRAAVLPLLLRGARASQPRARGSQASGRAHTDRRRRRDQRAPVLGLRACRGGRQGGAGIPRGDRGAARRLGQSPAGERRAPRGALVVWGGLQPGGGAGRSPSRTPALDLHARLRSAGCRRACRREADGYARWGPSMPRPRSAHATSPPGFPICSRPTTSRGSRCFRPTGFASWRHAT